MLKFLIFCAVWLVSFFVGSWGFPQIVGTIKYFGNFKTASALLTIVLWTAILGFGAFAVIKWLNPYKVAFFIGYGISFLSSLGTKPD